MEIVHTPVLLDECLDRLSPEGGPEHGAFMIDSTLGEGGHSYAFLEKYPDLHVLGVDADAQIQSRARERLAPFSGRMQFWNGWFDDFYASYPSGLARPDIILFDLGISVFHYERSGRGFSFRHDEALDMRLDALSPGGSRNSSAEELVNTLDERSLADLIYLYSEEKYSRRIAGAIVDARRNGRIVSSLALADIVRDAVPGSCRHGPVHPATRTFQALRIAVNGELSRLPKALHDAFNVLAPGGKMGVITFHSLEDRIVKNYFRNLGKQCVCPPQSAVCSCGGAPCAEVLTKKPVEPSEQEVSRNPPSRSAKLRVVRKLRDAGADRMYKEGILQ